MNSQSFFSILATFPSFRQQKADDIFRQSTHKKGGLIPKRACVWGQPFSFIADTIGRNILAEPIPVGVVVSLIGAPYFIYLLLKW
ncbi:Vitamin B12 import system permease protein BtuC [Geobacillus sp. TFV-3]|nr:iron chelate uptake ABC transporter family permease subunit [Geobacillus sp. TFV-3]KAF0993660.1 Vitamin B12 import system permease protein BtuC [Geobacillus sp. TFV-3]